MRFVRCSRLLTMKTIRRFSNVAEVGFARSLLEAAGIHATLADEHVYTLGPLCEGIRLFKFPNPMKTELSGS